MTCAVHLARGRRAATAGSRNRHDPCKHRRHSRIHRNRQAPDCPATGRPRRGSISRTSAAGTDAI